MHLSQRLGCPGRCEGWAGWWCPGWNPDGHPDDCQGRPCRSLCSEKSWPQTLAQLWLPRRPLTCAGLNVAQLWSNLKWMDKMCSAVSFCEVAIHAHETKLINCFVRGVYCISTKGEYQQLLLDAFMRKLKGCRESLLLGLMWKDTVRFGLAVSGLWSEYAVINMSMLPMVLVFLARFRKVWLHVIAACDMFQRIIGACLGYMSSLSCCETIQRSGVSCWERTERTHSTPCKQQLPLWLQQCIVRGNIEGQKDGTQ